MSALESAGESMSAGAFSSDPEVREARRPRFQDPNGGSIWAEAEGIQLGCSSSVRAWSIWSLGVGFHGRLGHRLTIAGERFVGQASEETAAFSIFFPMDYGSSVSGSNGGNTGPPTAAGGGAGTGIPSPGRTGTLENPADPI